MQNPTLGRRIASGLLALLMMLQVFSGIAMPKSGIVAGDTVALNETLAYGYYSDQYPTDDFFSAEPEERIHTGNHAIKALTNLNLINNPYGNYYIRSETFTGSIKPRPLYLHSLYHDQTDYKWTYDSRARSIGAEKNLNDLVVYGDAELTVKEVYEAILAGTRNDRDTTRYVADQYRAYEEEVKDPNNYRMYDNCLSSQRRLGFGPAGLRRTGRRSSQRKNCFLCGSS